MLVHCCIAHCADTQTKNDFLFTFPGHFPFSFIKRNACSTIRRRSFVQSANMLESMRTGATYFAIFIRLFVWRCSHETHDARSSSFNYVVHTLHIFQYYANCCKNMMRCTCVYFILLLCNITFVLASLCINTMEILWYWLDATLLPVVRDQTSQHPDTFLDLTRRRYVRDRLLTTSLEFGNGQQQLLFL